MSRLALDARRQIEHLLEMQRELSRTRPVAETVREFLRLIHAITPADWLMYLKCEAGGAADCWRVLYDGPVGDDILGVGTMEAMFSDESEQYARIEGGMLSEIIGHGSPRIRNDIEINAVDPCIGHLSGKARSLLAVPIYDEGRITCWCIHFAADPGVFEDAHLRLALSNSNMLARSIMQLVALDHIEDLNRRLEGQLRELAGVQRSLLPRSTPKIDGWQLATSYRTSLHAGGDYFDFTSFNDGYHGVVIADVSGHGAAAAAVMAVLRTILHTLAQTGVGSSETIDLVNRVVLESVGEGMFVSAYFIAIEPVTGRLTCVNCGHPSPRLLRRDAEHVMPLDGDGVPPLGIVDYETVPACDHVLEPGDALVLYTDGITEAFDADRHMFGTRGMDQAIIKGRGDADAIVRAIEADVAAHTPTARVDDQTLVVVQRRRDS